MSNIINNKFDVAVYIEIHCDECNEIIHFHIDCPVCKKEHSSTDYYGSPSNCIEDGGLFKCENCNSPFKLLKYDYCEEPEAEVLLITPSEFS